VHPNEDWLDCNQAATLCGYKDSGSIAKFAKKNNIETRQGLKRGWNLYSKAGLLKALDESQARYINRRFENPVLRRFDTHFKLTGNHLVFADTHCPLVDVPFVKQAVKTAHKQKVGRLIVAGDFWDCCALSIFPKMFPIPWGAEKASGRSLLEFLCKEMDRIYFLTGNHEMRYFLKLGIPQTDDALVNGLQTDIWELAETNLRKEFKNRLRASVYPMAEVDDWFITHPKNFRVIPGSTGRTLNQIEWKKNIIIGHAHMTAINQSPAGNGWLVDLGTMFDPINCDYKNLQSTSHPKWTESFGVLKDGFCTVYVKKDGKAKSLMETV